MTSFRKFFVGGKLNPTAAQANAWNRSAQSHEQSQNRNLPALQAKMRNSTRILVSNDSGGELPAFSVLEITGSAIDPDVNENEYLSSPAMAGGTVTDGSTSKFVITQKLLLDGDIDANAIISGVTYARLTGPVDQPNATPVTGESTLLASGSGPCVILDDPGPADEERTGIVRVGSSSIKVERGIITEVGASGVHKAFLITGSYQEDLEAPDIVDNFGTTEVYTGDHIIRNLEPGDNIMVAQVGGQWWIVEVSEDCRGGCVDEPQPLSIPGYIERYKWHMPYIPCCPEASGTWILEAVSESSDTDWESDTFQCNSDGTDRKWVYDGTKIQIEPIPGVGSIQYRHEEGNKLCPTKMYKFGGVFPEDCGEFPRVACMVPLCTGKSNANICGGKIHRNWMVTFDGTVTGTGCENFVSGRTYTAIFNDAPSSDITGEFKQVYTGNTVELIGNNGAPSIFVNADPSSTNNRFQLTSHVVYKVRDAGDFNCDGLNILDLDSNTSATCTGFPDTIYAFPIDDEYITSHCCPTSNQPLYSSNPGSNTDLESYWQCENIPYILELEFTSVANDSCSNCDVFNQVHKLHLDGSGRTGGAAWRDYDATHQTDCNGFSVDARYYVVLSVSGLETPYFRVSNTSGTPSGGDILYARYELTAGSISDWNCKGSNEFTLVSESGYCDFPSTATVRPCSG